MEGFVQVGRGPYSLQVGDIREVVSLTRKKRFENWQRGEKGHHFLLRKEAFLRGLRRGRETTKFVTENLETRFNIIRTEQCCTNLWDTSKRVYTAT